MALCGAVFRSVLFGRSLFCTKPAGHPDGDAVHVAALGPVDAPGARVLAKWIDASDDPPDSPPPEPMPDN